MITGMIRRPRPPLVRGFIAQPGYPRAIITGIDGHGWAPPDGHAAISYLLPDGVAAETVAWSIGTFGWGDDYLGTGANPTDYVAFYGERLIVQIDADDGTTYRGSAMIIEPLPIITGVPIIDNTSPAVGDHLTFTAPSVSGERSTSWSVLLASVTQPGTDAAEYDVPAGADGKALQARFFASNLAGTVSAISAATDPIAPAPSLAVTITGLTVNSIHYLTAQDGTTLGSTFEGTANAHRWMRSATGAFAGEEVAVAGATSASLAVDIPGGAVADLDWLRKEASEDGGSTWYASAAVRVRYGPPVVVASPPDRNYTAMITLADLNLIPFIDGDGGAWDLSPGSDPLPAGMSLSSGGQVTVAPTASVAGAVISPRLTNSGGAAAIAFSLSVSDFALIDMPDGTIEATLGADSGDLDVTLTGTDYAGGPYTVDAVALLGACAALTAPVISGSGVVGATLTVSRPGLWAYDVDAGPPEIAGEWYADGVATGETSTTYLVQPEDASLGITFVEAALQDGSPVAEATSNSIAITAAAVWGLTPGDGSVTITSIVAPPAAPVIAAVGDGTVTLG